MRVAVLALTAALITGCASTATTQESGTSPTPSTQAPSLAEVFPDAGAPRVPSAEDMIGSWKVVAPAEPPAGDWTEKYSAFSFFREETWESFQPKGFTPTPIFTLAMTAKIDCNGGQGPLAVAADGSAGTDPGWMMTTMGCGEGEFPYSFYDKVDRVAIDSAGYLWIANSDGVFKAKKAKGSN